MLSEDIWRNCIACQLDFSNCIKLSMVCKSFSCNKSYFIESVINNTGITRDFFLQNNIDLIDTVRNSDFLLKSLDILMFSTHITAIHAICYPITRTYKNTNNTFKIFQLLRTNTKSKYVLYRYITYINNIYNKEQGYNHKKKFKSYISPYQ